MKARISAMLARASACLILAIQLVFAPALPAQDGTLPAKPAPAPEVATLAGGCFWGMQEIIRKIPGVISSQVGYTGGDTKLPTYYVVATGKTGHAEAVRIEFNPSVLPYNELLKLFFRMHDPTTLNSQGHDTGTQYRSAIFYHSEEQKKVAEQVKQEIDLSNKWSKPIVTEIAAARDWYPAEEHHQDYLQKHVGGYSCHFLRD